MTEHTSTRAAEGKRPRAKRRTTVTSVFGELLLTAGVVVMLYVAWQMWIGDWIQGNQNNESGASTIQEWANLPSDAIAPPKLVEPTDGTAPYYEPPIMAKPASGEKFAVVRIPRFGSNYTVDLRGGVQTYESLNIGALGYYPETQMPGETGNFAMAGHRGSHGAPFQYLPGLHINDAIVIETKDGWYTYRYRNLEYVTPDAGEVLFPVPQQEGVEANGSYLTMTTCSPRYGWDERAIAYAEFESFTPRMADKPNQGAPDSLKDVKAVGS